MLLLFGVFYLDNNWSRSDIDNPTHIRTWLRSNSRRFSHSYCIDSPLTKLNILLEYDGVQFGHVDTAQRQERIQQDGDTERGHLLQCIHSGDVDWHCRHAEYQRGVNTNSDEFRLVEVTWYPAGLECVVATCQDENEVVGWGYKEAVAERAVSFNVIGWRREKQLGWSGGMDQGTNDGHEDLQKVNKNLLFQKTFKWKIWKLAPACDSCYWRPQTRNNGRLSLLNLTCRGDAVNFTGLKLRCFWPIECG